MASKIKNIMKEIDDIIVSSQSVRALESEAELIEPTAAAPVKQNTSTSSYSIPTARSQGTFDKKHFEKIQTSSYYAYTRRYDETVRAQELSDPSELMRLYKYINKLSPSAGEYSSLTKQLSGQIGKLGTPPSISFSLLLDNSGSMRSEKIIRLASSVLWLMEWLERWQIRTEVLGFTTRAWRGGQSRELWLSDGKPARPGRLNDLRHIIYKSFDESALVASPNLGIMAREGLLKENIDGEALL
jgi:cobaltochelatase CobT